MDHASLCVIQDDHYKYVHFAALPPLLFDLERDPDQFVNRAADPTYADIVRSYAQKALSWRMVHADRSLTHFRTTPRGLEKRDGSGEASLVSDRPADR
jgi:arylsulfatase A-like enzyme